MGAGASGNIRRVALPVLVVAQRDLEKYEREHEFRVVVLALGRKPESGPGDRFPVLLAVIG